MIALSCSALDHHNTELHEDWKVCTDCMLHGSLKTEAGTHQNGVVALSLEVPKINANLLSLQRQPHVTLQLEVVIRVTLWPATCSVVSSIHS
jgi:hypothetical protein